MKINLAHLLNYHDYQISSRSLSRLLGLEQEVTIYAMAAGESISNERSPQTKLIQVLEGRLQVSFENNSAQVLVSQDLLAIEAQTLHQLLAVEKCKFLQISL